MTQKNTIFINTRITVAEKKALDKRAKESDRKLADLLRQIIRNFLNAN